MSDGLVRVHREFTAWLFGRAYPFWLDIGCDRGGEFGAEEHLTLAGVPARPGFKRLRVQARQLYAFTFAALRGVDGAAGRAEGVYRFMMRARREDGGWARRLGEDGTVLDARAELYDIAFVIFALAWYERLARDGVAARVARETIGWLYRAMATGRGGFHVMLPVEAGLLQQNPHMHLLEAALAVFETTGEERDLGFVNDLLALFGRHLFDERSGTLGEYFGADWSPAAGAAGEVVEPGHHFEWVWLLHEHARLTGGGVRPEAGRLYAMARFYGVDRESGLVFDTVDRAGVVTGQGARLWAQTEALRADCAMGEGVRAATVGENLLGKYFPAVFEGGWMDQFSADGQAASDKIPASSFYHIVAGWAELDRFVGNSAH